MRSGALCVFCMVLISACAKQESVDPYKEFVGEVQELMQDDGVDEVVEYVDSCFVVVSSGDTTRTCPKGFPAYESSYIVTRGQGDTTLDLSLVRTQPFEIQYRLSIKIGEVEEVLSGYMYPNPGFLLGAESMECSRSTSDAHFDNSQNFCTEYLRDSVRLRICFLEEQSTSKSRCAEFNVGAICIPFHVEW